MTTLTLEQADQGEKAPKSNAEGPQERRRRYEQLKTSAAALRSRVRSAPSSIRSTPPPSRCSDSPNTLIPYAAYFSKFSSPSPAFSRPSSRADDAHQYQIEASGLLESHAMHALRLDCEMKLKESQEEMDKLRERLQDKTRRTEVVVRELERQRRKLEAKISFFSEQSKLLEQQLSEQANRHAQELQLQREAFEEKKGQELSKVASSYEDSVEALRKTNEAQTEEIDKLEREYSFRLEQMERSKDKADNQMKYLDVQMRLVAEQAEKFRINYEEQEKEWNQKLQHVTTMHQFQIKSLRHEYELQLEKLRKEKDDEKEQHNISLQAYKTQKLKDMEYVEARVKALLEVKEATITQLKLELGNLHQQLLASASSFLEDDIGDVVSQGAQP